MTNIKIIAKKITSKNIKKSLINMTVAIGIGIILDATFCLMQLKAVTDPKACDGTKVELDASNCQYGRILLDAYVYSFSGLVVALPFLFSYFIKMVNSSSFFG